MAKSEFPKSVVGQRSIAELICRKFGIRCQQQDIQNWRNLLRVHGANVPFPAPAPGNHYEVKKCFRWVEKFIMPHRNGAEDAETEEPSIKQQLEAEKLSRLKKQGAIEDGLWIPRATAENTAIGVIKQLLTFYKQTDEQRTPAELERQLTVPEVAPELKKAIMDWFVGWQRAITDQREAAMAKAAEVRFE